MSLRELNSMRLTTPCMAPPLDRTVHIVLDDFGNLGRAYRETDEELADLETVIGSLLAGEFSNPVRIVAFNTTEGWARDVSQVVAWEVVRRAEKEGKWLVQGTHQFVVFHTGEDDAPRVENSLLQAP